MELQNTEITEGSKKKVKKQKAVNANGTPKKKKKTKWIVAGGIVVVLVGTVVVNSIASSGKAMPVTTIKSTLETIDSTIDTSGNVKSELTRTYYSMANTYVEDMEVAVGEIVKKGEQLMTYDVEWLESASKQRILQGQASSFDYKGTAQENSKFQNQLAQAVTDIQNYQALMANYKQYITDLEESISDEVVKKRADYNNQLYSLQHSANTYSHQLSLSGTSRETADNIQHLLSDNANEQSRIQKELSALSDYKTKDNREDVLTQAKNDYSDIEIAYNEARSKQAGAEGAIQNGNKLKAAALNSEATQAAGKDAIKILEEAQRGVVADFSGVITEVSVAEGTPINDGLKLLTLESNEDVKVEISASKYDLEKLELGQKADVTVGGESYQGTVSKISQVALPNESGTPMVKVDVHIDNPDDKIYLGLEGKVSIHTVKVVDVVAVPVEAVNADSQGDFCYVVENGIVVRKPVTLGITSDIFVEVVEGLKEGADILVSLPAGIIEGSKVSVTPPPTVEAATE